MLKSPKFFNMLYDLRMVILFDHGKCYSSSSGFEVSKGV
jgi:hypothetical protein